MRLELWCLLAVMLGSGCWLVLLVGVQVVVGVGVLGGPVVFESEFVLSDCLVVRSERELGVMVAEVLDSSREYPVVCLTSRMGEVDPALSPAAVRDIVGPGIPVYFVGNKRLQMLLATRLPARLDVYGGATRVWWPGVSEQSDRMDHPLILTPRDAYTASSLERLAREFRLTTRGPVELNERQRAVLAERQLERERHRNDQLEKELRSFERALADMRRDAARSAEGVPGGERERSRDPEVLPRRERAAGARRAEPQDIEAELRRLISLEWAQALQRADYATHPLGRYLLGEEFLKGIIARNVDTPLPRIAWVCAMVACGLASTQNGLQPHPLLTGSAGTQLIREDGAKGWRCSIRRSTYGAPRLHYWEHPDGTVEFTAIGNHETLGAL